MADQGESLRISEAKIRHQLCMLMAHERQLQALIKGHPTLDELVFEDLRMAIINCNRAFGRIYG